MIISFFLINNLPFNFLNIFLLMNQYTFSNFGVTHTKKTLINRNLLSPLNLFARSTYIFIFNIKIQLYMFRPTMRCFLIFCFAYAQPFLFILFSDFISPKWFRTRNILSIAHTQWGVKGVLDQDIYIYIYKFSILSSFGRSVNHRFCNVNK